MDFERTGEIPQGAIQLDLESFPIEHLSLPSQVLYPAKDQAYKVGRSAANSFQKSVSRRLGTKGRGIQFHHSDPVALGGAPKDPANLIPLLDEVHEQIVTPWWNPWTRQRNQN